MRSYSQEKSRQREEELRIEVIIIIIIIKTIIITITIQVDRIQAEIKQLQRNSEESATVSDKLNREVTFFLFYLRELILVASK